MSDGNKSKFTTLLFSTIYEYLYQCKTTEGGFSDDCQYTDSDCGDEDSHCFWREFRPCGSMCTGQYREIWYPYLADDGSRCMAAYPASVVSSIVPTSSIETIRSKPISYLPQIAMSRCAIACWVAIHFMPSLPQHLFRRAIAHVQTTSG